MARGTGVAVEQDREDESEVALAVKRLNINLPAKAFDELQMMARSSGRTMTDIVRLALGLVVVAIDETERGNRLAIASQDGHLLREIVLPR